MLDNRMPTGLQSATEKKTFCLFGLISLVALTTGSKFSCNQKVFKNEVTLAPSGIPGIWDSEAGDLESVCESFLGDFDIVLPWKVWELLE